MHGDDKVLFGAPLHEAGYARDVAGVLGSHYGIFAQKAPFWAFLREKGDETRLTYNCAHLRSTKESLTFKYFDTGRYWLVLGQYRTVRVDI